MVTFAHILMTIKYLRTSRSINDLLRFVYSLQKMLSCLLPPPNFISRFWLDFHFTLILVLDSKTRHVFRMEEIIANITYLRWWRCIKQINRLCFFMSRVHPNNPHVLPFPIFILKYFLYRKSDSDLIYCTNLWKGSVCKFLVIEK